VIKTTKQSFSIAGIAVEIELLTSRKKVYRVTSPVSWSVMLPLNSCHKNQMDLFF